MDIDKKKHKETLNKIRVAMMESWDPLDIQDSPESFDEYDAFASHILSLLVKGAKAKHEPNARKAGSQAPAYTEIPIQLEALTGFHQLGAFLSRVEQGEPPMQVRSLRINENPKLLRRQAVKMTLVVYAMPSMPSGKPAAANAPGSAGPGGS